MATAYPIQDPNDLILQMQTEINGQPLRTVLPRTRAMLTTNVQPAAAAPRNPIEGYRSRAAELYGQGSELYNREPDMSAIEEFARARSQSGNSAMLNALAAQFAGEQFQPVQAQYLKRAAAAQDPIKFGSGMMTPDGKFIRDPESLQNKRAEFLMQQARAYEQMAQTAQTAQERAQAQASQQQIGNELRLMGLQIQQGNAIDRADARRDRDLAQKEEKEFKFSNQYKQETKQLSNIIRSAEFVRANAERAKAGDPQAQMAMVYQFMKALDEGSVVRESEYAMAANARPLIETFSRIYEQVMQGTRLSSKQIDNMVATVDRIGSVAQTGVAELEDSYAKRAIGARLRPEQIFGRPYGTQPKVDNSQANGAPQGVDPKLWQHMTPQERELWKTN